MNVRKEMGKSEIKAGRDVLLFWETDDNGKAHPDMQQLLACGRAMTEKTGGQVVAVRTGMFSDASSKVSFDTSSTRMTAQALAQTIEQYAPYALLFSASMKNRVLAGETAALTGTGIVSDAQLVRVLKRDMQTVWRKQSFGGYLQTDVLCAKGVTQIALLTPGVFAERKHEAVIHEADDAHFDQPDEVLFLKTLPAKSDTGPFSETPSADANILPRLIKKHPKRTVDLEHAEVIVAGGRGVRGAEGFALLKELADALGGVVAASRVAVDQGWIGKECLIGQSGKSVKPRLYIACGISGSVQHITGMRNAGCVVSVNTDKKALIFNVSDYCIVGDLFEVIPALIRQVKA